RHAGHRDARATTRERELGRLGQPDDLTPELEIARRLPRAYQAHELRELRYERLGGRDLRREDVAASIRELILAERLGVAIDHSPVEHTHWLRSAVLVYDHLLTPDDRRAAKLAWRQPAQLDVGNDA